MIKGVNHTIIEVSNPCNRYFERALLFVRPTLEEIPARRLQLQADCFVENLGTPPATKAIVAQNRRNRKLKRLILSVGWWLIGFISGGLLTWLLYSIKP